MTANLNDESLNVITGNDNVVIVDVFQTIRGGRTLDTTGFTPDVINAGHVIIEETATGNLKPMPINGTAYSTLPAGHTYKGILITSILTAKPMASILLHGTVNYKAAPYDMTSILTAVKAALPLITFLED